MQAAVDTLRITSQKAKSGGWFYHLNREVFENNLGVMFFPLTEPTTRGGEVLDRTLDGYGESGKDLLWAISDNIRGINWTWPCRYGILIVPYKEIEVHRVRIEQQLAALIGGHLGYPDCKIQRLSSQRVGVNHLERPLI